MNPRRIVAADVRRRSSIQELGVRLLTSAAALGAISRRLVAVDPVARLKFPSR
jgi:hypothetical protein